MPQISESRRIVAAVDLDDTIFRSRADRRPTDIAVDYGSRGPCSFMSPEEIRAMRELTGRIFVIPVTSRSVHQYTRLVWPDGCEPKIALAANGGILIRDGVLDASWSIPYLEEASALMPRICDTMSSLRSQPGYRTGSIVDELFACVAYDNAEHAWAALDDCDARNLEIVCSGPRVYAFPPSLDKGLAVRELMKQDEFSGYELFAAGDSLIDLPMLREASYAAAAPSLSQYIKDRSGVRFAGTDQDMPEFVMQMLAGLIRTDAGRDFNEESE